MEVKSGEKNISFSLDKERTIVECMSNLLALQESCIKGLSSVWLTQNTEMNGASMDAVLFYKLP